MKNTIIWDGKELEQMIVDSLPENDDDQTALQESILETAPKSSIPEMDEDTYLDQARGFM